MLNTIATPILLYASEALFLNKSEINNLNHSYCRELCKIFNVFKSEYLQYCMNMFGIKNLCEIYNIRRENYVLKLKTLDIDLLSRLLNVTFVGVKLCSYILRMIIYSCQYNYTNI